MEQGWNPHPTWVNQALSPRVKWNYKKFQKFLDSWNKNISPWFCGAPIFPSADWRKQWSYGKRRGPKQLSSKGQRTRDEGLSVQFLEPGPKWGSVGTGGKADVDSSLVIWKSTFLCIPPLLRQQWLLWSLALESITKWVTRAMTSRPDTCIIYYL